MKRLTVLITLVTAFVLVSALTAPPAQARDLWEFLFGCDGLISISCPGPVIW